MGTRSVEHWLDTLVDVWGTVEDGEGKRIDSFAIFRKNELPSAPILAAQAPCVATYVDDVQPQYSTGGPTLLRWFGSSEFHLTKDVKQSNMADVMLYYERILAAAMANMKLSGKVVYFSIVQEQAQQMPMTLFIHPVSSQPDHQGITVKWVVEQSVSGLYTVSQ